MVAFSGTVSLALIVNVPAFSILELSPKTPSPLLSNWTWLVEELSVTTVALSVVTAFAN